MKKEHPTIIKTKESVENVCNIQWSFIRNGRIFYIHSINERACFIKHNPERYSMAITLSTLRNSGYKYTELNGFCSEHPVNFFTTLIAQGYKLERIEYDDETHSELLNCDSLEMSGFGYTADRQCKSFHFRFYDYHTYKQVKETIKPLLSKLKNIETAEYSITQAA